MYEHDTEFDLMIFGGQDMYTHLISDRRLHC